MTGVQRWPFKSRLRLSSVSVLPSGARDAPNMKPTADGAEKAVGTGAAEFGVRMAEGVLPARAGGIPIVSIGTILPVNDSALMSLAGEGITTPAGLAGKTYGG